ncbi:MAG: T9SS type A sorting domain-containing protein [Gracilimonas sp.]
MHFFKTIIHISAAVLIPFFYTSGQGVTEPKSVNVIALDDEDFEKICTLTSSDINAHYYVKSLAFRAKQNQAEKSADIQVTFMNESGSNTWPSEAKIAFEYAIGIWEYYLTSNIPIRVKANWRELGEFTLGSAGPTQIVQIDNGIPLTWYSIAQGSAISGIDFVSESKGSEDEINFDIEVNINSAWDDWYFGTDAQTPAGLIDFVTVVLHEIGHGLGFLGSMRVPEDRKIAEWGFGIPAYPIIYDRFVIDGEGNELTDRQAYANSSGQLYDAVTGQNGGIYFAGIQSIGSNDGKPAPLYAPTEWRSGSSYSHLDLKTYTNTENALMRPQIDRAFAIHSPGPVMCSIMADMGWPLGEECQDILGTDSEIIVNKEPIYFGVTNAGTTVERSLRITNDASATDPLVGRISVSGGNIYSVDNKNQFLTLYPGESTDVKIFFKPSKEGIVKGEFELIHTSTNLESPLNISLNGEALAKNEFFKLEQNYPNPFNATTIIPFVVSQTSQVKLEVYDALGKHIQTLVDGEQSPGRYAMPFRANDISSGLYIYRIIVEGNSKTGKLLLVK